MKVEATNNLFESVEYKLFEKLKVLGDAYARLTNPQFSNKAEALTALKEVQKAATDLEAITRKALNDYGLRTDMIGNVSAWTQDSLDNKWLNCHHYYMKYLHTSPGHPKKLKRLTAFYFLARDVRDICEFTTVDRYYKDLII